MNQQSIKDVQNKILEIMAFIDRICRKYDIHYYIMGGTALGAIRHKGFIPWDDDLDIFMKPHQYSKFKKAIECEKTDKFVLQEWKTVPEYLEYAKVRMNGTTFIEKAFKDRKEIHHGIYVDIMILHKCPNNRFLQHIIFYISKYVTLVALSKRKWKPKTRLQSLSLIILKILPNRLLSNLSYKLIYKYESLNRDYAYCYWITKAKFHQGLFKKEMFKKPVDVAYENTKLMGPTDIKKYLELRYGDFMKLPSEESRKASIHAELFDISKDYRDYIS